MIKSDNFIFDQESISDESYLVIIAQHRDQAAFAQLYEQNKERINRYITRMVGDPNIGWELTQETFLKAWEKLPDLQKPSAFASWLCRIATNATYNYLKHERLIRMIPWTESLTNVPALVLPSPEGQIEERELIQRALARVRPVYRACLILYMIEQQSRQCVADSLGVKSSSIDKYISRSKEAFRKMYYQMLDNE